MTVTFTTGTYLTREPGDHPDSRAERQIEITPIAIVEEEVAVADQQPWAV
jgi:hypothetical protein